MSKSIKLKDNNYWDSTGIAHNRATLKDKLDNIDTMLSNINTSLTNITNTLSILTNFDNSTVTFGTWHGLTLYRISKSILINTKGNQVIYTLPSNKCRIKICNAWIYKNASNFSNLVNWNADTKTNDFGVLYYNHDTGQIYMNLQDTGWLQLVVYYTIEN